MINEKNKITISIESAIEGGSISLRRDSKELDFWIGQKTVSKSEDLLAEIDFLLKKNNIKKNEILTVSVANSIGSLTGLRIGYSTALGIKRAIDCHLETFSVMTAVNDYFKQENSIVSIFLNESTIYFQSFKNIEKTEIHTNTKISSARDFLEEINKQDFQVLLVNQKFVDFITNHSIQIPKNIKLINLGKNLASYYKGKSH